MDIQINDKEKILMDIQINDEEKILMEPVIYYHNQNSKNIRELLTDHLGLYYSIDIKDIKIIKDIISYIHNASLVIDDIQDESQLRRNKPCAHIVYGIASSINASYLIIFKVLKEINKRTDLSEEIKHNITEYIYYAHIGQGLDIYYTEHKIIPPIHKYEELIEYKTGMLFYPILDLMVFKTNNKIIENKNDEIRTCLKKFALFFQIRDDYINITSKKYWEERGFCQDFDEKKISYLITFCTNNKMDKFKKINKLMEKDNKTNKYKIRIIKLMYDNGLLNIIYSLLDELKKEILNILNLEAIFAKLPYEKFNMDNIHDYLHI
jgi:geranylgeranyl diphosphate synthase, type III